MEARSIDFSLRYNKAPFTDDISKITQSLTYTDCASDSSDSIRIEIDAEDSSWANSWMPDEGATLYPKLTGKNWNYQGDSHTMDCGLFTLDDLSFSGWPHSLTLGAVAKPSDTDFSEQEREQVWKKTSIKKIGETIASRYGLGFTFDADDYSVECWEQDGTDSSEYNELCGYYGLILKVYAKRLWVYDRETYKAKAAVKTITPTDIEKSSFQWQKGIAGTYTGGYFSYTDSDKDADITASVGGGNRTKSVNRYASSVADAAIQLVAEINKANHGQTSASFKLPGEWNLSSGQCITLSGFGTAIDGKYFIDKIEHTISRSGGFESSISCSLCTTPFYAKDVGGNISQHSTTTTSGTSYTSTYQTTASGTAASSGVSAGAAVTLSKAPFYYTSTAAKPSCYKSGTFYFYDGILIAGRYRLTNLASRCGKLPVGQNVTGWVPASYCT